MWRCLVEENVRAGQVSNVGCGNEHRPMVANDKHKLEEKYEREYEDMVKVSRMKEVDLTFSYFLSSFLFFFSIYFPLFYF